MILLLLLEYLQWTPTNSEFCLPELALQEGGIEEKDTIGSTDRNN